MKNKTFRRIARGVFHISSFILNIKYKKSNFSNIKNIIIFKPDNVGDFILSIPAIDSIKKQFPNSKITCVVHPESSIIAGRVCDSVIEYISPYVHSKGIENNVNFHYISKLNKTIINTKYDLILDLRSDILTLLFAFKSKAKYRIDVSSYRIMYVFQKTLNIFFGMQFFKQKKMHELELISKVLKKSGINVVYDFYLPEILNEEDIVHCLKIIPRDLIKKSFAIFHPGASWEYKRWNPDKFAKIADFIISNYNLDVVIVGSKNEMNIAEAIKSMVKNKEKVLNLCGKTNIMDLIYLSKKSALAVCNDSALGHITAMCEAKTISLFGAQDPEIFGPKGKNVYIIKKNVKCSPCAQINCIKPEGKRCMDLITVNDVMDIIEGLNKNGKLK